MLASNQLFASLFLIQPLFIGRIVEAQTPASARGKPSATSGVSLVFPPFVPDGYHNTYLYKSGSVSHKMVCLKTQLCLLSAKKLKVLYRWVQNNERNFFTIPFL